MKFSNTMILYYYWFYTTLTNAQIYGFVLPDNEKCRYTRVEKLLKARCHGMNLKEVPQYVTSGVEVLDLSFNRIKKLKRLSFQRYKDIRFLLLYDNMIQTIEPGTFSFLNSLEEIDLSNNGLLTIPLELFNLPSLRNLYVDSNELVYLHDDLKNLQKPIRAPLEYLNIADCGLNDIPYLGILPKLWHLNASLNPLDQLNVQTFSPLCHLKSIDLDKTTIPYCSCQLIMMFLGIRKIKAHNSNFCDTIRNIDEIYCQDATNMTIFNEDFENCTNVIVTTKFQIEWTFIAISIGVAFIVLTGLILCINQRKMRKNKKRMLPSTSPKNINNTSNTTKSIEKSFDQHLLENPS